MENNLGIKNLKLVVTAIATLGNVVGEVLEDGKVTWKDLRSAPDLIFGLAPLTEIDLSEVIPEAGDLSEDEVKELAEHFKTYFDLQADSLEAIIEEGLELALQGANALQFFITQFKK